MMVSADTFVFSIHKISFLSSRMVPVYLHDVPFSRLQYKHLEAPEYMHVQERMNTDNNGRRDDNSETSVTS